MRFVQRGGSYWLEMIWRCGLPFRITLYFAGYRLRRGISPMDSRSASIAVLNVVRSGITQNQTALTEAFGGDHEYAGAVLFLVSFPISVASERLVTYSIEREVCNGARINEKTPLHHQCGSVAWVLFL